MLPAFVATVATRMTRYAPQPKPSPVATEFGSERDGSNWPVCTARKTTPSAPVKNHHVCATFAPIHGPAVPAGGVRAQRGKSPIKTPLPLFAAARGEKKGKGDV